MNIEIYQFKGKMRILVKKNELVCCHIRFESNNFFQPIEDQPNLPQYLFIYIIFLTCIGFM